MDNNILPEILNWKLREVISCVKLISSDSSKFKHDILEKLKLPISSGYKFDASMTEIDWKNMSKHYYFYFDKVGWEENIKSAFEESKLKETKNLLITYGFKEPVVIIPTKVFLEDWDGFIASTVYQSLMFSEDFKLIMEISRDYYLHSNFEILTNG